jgi:hypothetical protein
VASHGVDDGNVRRVIVVPPVLIADLDQVVSRLRNSSAARLRAAVSGPFATRAGAGRALARLLAQATQGIEAAAAEAPPAWRTLPTLPEPAVGDQVRVLAHDFVSVLPTSPPEVWGPDGRVGIDDVIRDVAATVTEVARYL